jgi:hypothetical protein
MLGFTILIFWACLFIGMALLPQCNAGVQQKLVSKKGVGTASGNMLKKKITSYFGVRPTSHRSGITGTVVVQQNFSSSSSSSMSISTTTATNITSSTTGTTTFSQKLDSVFDKRAREYLLDLMIRNGGQQSHTKRGHQHLPAPVGEERSSSIDKVLKARRTKYEHNVKDAIVRVYDLYSDKAAAIAAINSVRGYETVRQRKNRLSFDLVFTSFKIYTN